MHSTMCESIWNDYALIRGNRLGEFWTSHLAEKRRDVLFVLGLGFDPRMCLGVETVLASGETGRCDCLLVKYHEGEESASRHHAADVEANEARLKAAIEEPERGEIRSVEVQMLSSEGRRIGPVGVARAFAGPEAFKGYSDVVVDISALPRSMYFPILSRLLSQCLDDSLPNVNLHVLVAEDVSLDTRIAEVGTDEDASYMPGFCAQIDMEYTKGIPKLWVPVVGENKIDQLQKIRALVAPNEVCPVVPFPSKDPRRGDSLLFTHQYSEFFFDDLQIDSSNVVYAHEQNPFQVYRQIRDVVRRHSRAFESLGGCSAVLSALSSKLSSVGVLLAAVELKRDEHLVGIAQVDTRGYRINESEESGSNAPEHELFHLWLCGECYAS